MSRRTTKCEECAKARYEIRETSLMCMADRCASTVLILQKTNSTSYKTS